MDGDDYRFKTLMNVTVSLALECGVAEEVIEQWQAWKRSNDFYYVVVSNLKICGYPDNNNKYDDECFKSGNYFRDEETATQARDRILETLKQFHKEHKTQ